MRILGPAWSVPRVPRTSGSSRKQRIPPERPGPPLLPSDPRRQLGTRWEQQKPSCLTSLLCGTPSCTGLSPPQIHPSPQTSPLLRWNISGITSRVSAVLRFLTECYISHLPVWKLAFLMRHHSLCGFTRGDRVRSLPRATSRPLVLSPTWAANICLFEAFPHWQHPQHRRHSGRTSWNPFLLHFSTPRSDVILGDINTHTHHSMHWPFSLVSTQAGTQMSSSLTATLGLETGTSENKRMHPPSEPQTSFLPATCCSSSFSYSLNSWFLQSHKPSTLFQATRPVTLHHFPLKVRLSIFVLQLSTFHHPCQHSMLARTLKC